MLMSQQRLQAAQLHVLAGWALPYIHTEPCDVQTNMSARVRDTIWAFITTKKRSRYTWQQWTARPTALPAINELAQSLADERVPSEDCIVVRAYTQTHALPRQLPQQTGGKPG
jgi:hypothetical protein